MGYKTLCDKLCDDKFKATLGLRIEQQNFNLRFFTITSVIILSHFEVQFFRKTSIPYARNPPGEKQKKLTFSFEHWTMDERVEKMKKRLSSKQGSAPSFCWCCSSKLEKEEKTKIAITKTKEFQMRNFYKLDYDEQALKVISSFLFLISKC